MSIGSTLFSSKTLAALVVCCAVPLTASTPQETRTVPKADKAPPFKKPPKPKPQECAYEETGKQICHDNGYGDQECVPEIIEHCPQPI